MMEKYDERLKLMKDMESGIVGGGDDPDDSGDDSDFGDGDEESGKLAQPRKQTLKFGRAKEGTATVVEVYCSGCFCMLWSRLTQVLQTVIR